MTSGLKRIGVSAGTLLALTFLRPSPAAADVVVTENGGWQLSTDGRVNAFASVARGTRVPELQPDFPGSVTDDTEDTEDNIRSTRIRNGFLASILGFKLQKEVSPNLKVTARVALWMNISSGRTKNIPGPVDPRELYAKLEGGWGSFLGGSDLSLFGRGGILTDAVIAHEYGVGYPCLIQDASGGACGMAAFGAVFPGFEPGFVYTTPSLHGLELSLGAYDPANIGVGQLNRTPLPRLEGELSYKLDDLLHVYANGFWQKLEGTIPNPGGVPVGSEIDIERKAWGAQAGAMVAVGPVMLGGAAFTGTGIAPISHVSDHQTAVDKTGEPRKSWGAFGLGAFTFEALQLKVAGGAGIFHVDKTKNDGAPVSDTGVPQNPQVMKQNLGVTVGLYQNTGPVHFALEYFRAEHTLYEYGQQRPDNPLLVDIRRPQQAVNFINAGMTLVW